MIGLLTFHWADDYGAMLQAYALKRVLAGLGGGAEVIPYAPYRLTGRYWWYMLRYRCAGGVWRVNWRESLRFWLRHPLPDGDFLRRRRAMARFRRRYLTRRRPVRRAERLSLAGYRCVFVGSDQVWNPKITLGLDPAYTGGLPGRGNCRLAAYGASLGGSRLPEEDQETFRLWVGAAFDGLSLREGSAVPFVQELLGRPAEAVLDPVLLLRRSEWDEIAAAPKEEGHVLVYQTEPDPALLEYARKTARTLGKPVVSVSFSRYEEAPDWVERRTGIGPAEFVGYIRGADCVVTNSFHGTVCSILYHKPFLTLPLRRSGEKNSRLEDLLAALGLESRLAAGELQDQAVWEPVDWPEVERRLEGERARSLAFIQANLTAEG